MSYSIRLPVFEGPLHLLLHLIRAQKLEITDIPIASVTEQYLEYLALMEELNLDVAGEFLVMAATLMEIKSRMLLPKPPRASPEDEGPDPREELVQKLLEYERFQEVAGELRRMEQEMKRSFPRQLIEEGPEAQLAELSPADLLGALRRMLAEYPKGNGKKETTLRVRREAISLRARVAEIWQHLRSAPGPVPFSELMPPHRRSRAHIVVTFMAILELLRDGKLTAWQRGVHGEILLAPGSEPLAES